MLRVNATLTEVLLVVFHVADGSALGSGFSATYGGTWQGLVSRNSTRLISAQTSMMSTAN